MGPRGPHDTDDMIYMIFHLDENDTIHKRIDTDDEHSHDDYDYIASETDDTSAEEHVSERSDSSNSGVDPADSTADRQPETLEKENTVWFINPITKIIRFIHWKKGERDTAKLEHHCWSSSD
ncbi:unnamed protein product [Adineta ricciae]|uniref:Uncharacterized protein n=1 Tax=Adineta ricciae TaxID=249248 RepID=A0A816D189_ADIRI|nr:unnamed protein product [Adineta ricciae]